MAGTRGTTSANDRIDELGKQMSVVIIRLEEIGHRLEALDNRIVGLSPMDLMSCFISGLKIKIRKEVLAQQPSSMTLIGGLARRQEDKFHDQIRALRPKTFHNQNQPCPPLNPTPSGLFLGCYRYHRKNSYSATYLNQNLLRVFKKGFASTYIRSGRDIIFVEDEHLCCFLRMGKNRWTNAKQSPQILLTHPLMNQPRSN